MRTHSGRNDKLHIAIAPTAAVEIARSTEVMLIMLLTPVRSLICYSKRASRSASYIAHWDPVMSATVAIPWERNTSTTKLFIESIAADVVNGGSIGIVNKITGWFQVCVTGRITNQFKRISFLLGNEGRHRSLLRVSTNALLFLETWKFISMPTLHIGMQLYCGSFEITEMRSWPKNTVHNEKDFESSQDNKNVFTRLWLQQSVTRHRHNGSRDSCVLRADRDVECGPETEKQWRSAMPTRNECALNISLLAM